MNGNATANNTSEPIPAHRKSLAHYIGLIIMVMGPFVAFAQSSPDKNVPLMVQADTLLGRQDYEGALTLLNKIIEKSKLASESDYDALYKRAFCYYGLEKFENALADVNEYLKKIPNDQARLLRAYINQELGNYDAQLEDLNVFIEASPGNPELLRWRASVYMESERYDEARNDITQLLQFQDSPDLKGYLGLVYYYQNNPDSALVIFDDVIKTDPEYLPSYLYASSVALEEEAYELAMKYINAGLKIEGDNLTLLFYKGVALIESDDRVEGCRCMTKAFNRGLDDAADYLKGYCYGSE